VYAEIIAGLFRRLYLSGSVTKHVFRHAGEPLCVATMAVSGNPSSFDYFLVENYLVEFVIFQE